MRRREISDGKADSLGGANDGICVAPSATHPPYYSWAPFENFIMTTYTLSSSLIISPCQIQCLKGGAIRKNRLTFVKIKNL
jgi:hypothetical protein